MLVHSHSKCVLEALKEAAKANRRLHVFSTQSNFDESGVRMQGRKEDFCFSLRSTFCHHNFLYNSSPRGVQHSLVQGPAAYLVYQSFIVILYPTESESVI